MEIEFILNFFNKLYLKNSLILFFYFLFLSYLIFHKKESFIKNPLFFLGRFIQVFVIILPITVIVNIFFPLDKKGAMINFLTINFLFLFFFYFSGGLASLKQEFSLIKNKKYFLECFKKIFFGILVSVFFVIYFNYSIFKVNTPFSWGINCDLYAHTFFINRLQNEKLPFADCKLNFLCLGQDLVFGYPRGVHSILAFLDTILPKSFINKTDYAFALFGILTASLVFFFAKKGVIFLILSLPLIFLPSFSIMLLRDHPNSALFQFCFFVFGFYFIKTFYGKKLNFENFFFLITSFIAGWFCYWFSMSFSIIPLLIFLLIYLSVKGTKLFLNSKSKNNFIILVIFLLFFLILIVIFLNYSKDKISYIQNLAKSIIESAKIQHIVDIYGFNLKVNFKNFLGIDLFSYNYFDRYQKNIFYQGVTWVFWVIVFIVSLLNFKKKSLVSFLGILYFITFLMIEKIWPYSYLQIRIYSYLATFILIITYFFDLNFFQKKRLFFSIFLIISFLTLRWFTILHFGNQVYARANAARNISLDYKIPAFALKESNWKKKILSFHTQDFNRAFVLFFPYKYPFVYAFDRWDGRLVKDKIIFERYLNFKKRNLGTINFKNVDILVLPRDYFYPKNLFDIIQQDTNSVLIKKKSDFYNYPLIIDKKNVSFFTIKNEIEKFNQDNYFILKLENSFGNCYLISGKKNDLIRELEYLNNKIFYVEYLLLIISNESLDNINYACS